MCGICGEIRLDNSVPDQAQLERMLEVLQPRGPDDGGVWQDGALLFGHRRLSIIDLSDRSHQPMVVTDGAGNSYAVVFNGTIYNYRELRDELVGAGHSFRSSGDTEVILRAYQQ